jgi:hypothetical protein
MVDAILMQFARIATPRMRSRVLVELDLQTLELARMSPVQVRSQLELKRKSIELS